MITSVTSSHSIELAAVKGLWAEYWQAQGFPMEYQNFAIELDSLPGKYAPPKGRLLLVQIDGQPAATAALRPLSAEACEAKRLYVAPAFRGRRLAAALMEHLVEEARAEGYRRIYGNTFPTMRAALELYRRMGFVEVGPYAGEDAPGAIYLQLDL